MVMLVFIYCRPGWLSSTYMPLYKTVRRSMIDSTYVQLHPAQNFVQGAGLIGQGGSGRSAARRFDGETTPKHAAELRDCPCRPRAPQRVGVRVRVRAGSTCKVEVDDTSPCAGCSCTYISGTMNSIPQWVVLVTSKVCAFSSALRWYGVLSDITHVTRNWVQYWYYYY